MRRWMMGAWLVAAALLAGLAGCGNDSEGTGPFGILAQTAGQVGTAARPGRRCTRSAVGT